MRASRRRLDHSTEAGSSSVSTARSLKRPWMAKPSASSTARPMVTRPGGRPVRVDQVAVRQRGGHLQVAAEHLRRRLLGGGAVDVDALDQRADGRRSPRRCATAATPSSPASDATRPRRSRASRSSAHSGGHGLSRSVLSRSWSSSGVVGAGSISARTRSIASWVTRPSCSGRDRQAPPERDGAACAGRWPHRRRGTRRARR